MASRSAVALSVVFVVAILGAGALVPAAAQPPTSTVERLVKARTLHDAAGADFRAGRYRDGVPKAREALALREAVHGPDHAEVADSVARVAELLQETGDYAGARAAYERSLTIRERVFGPRHPQTALSLNGLGHVTLLLGDPAAARPLVERGLEIRERTLGPRHVLTSNSVQELGAILAAQGDYKGARALFERALAIREQATRPDQARIASALQSLGDMHRELGERAAARQYYERALKLREAQGHQPAIAASLNALGWLSHLEGDAAAARAGIERALAIREQVMGPEHPATAASMNDLGSVLLRVGRYTEARAIFERALRIREKNYGPDHVAVALSLRNLGEALRSAGDLARARPLLERSVALYEKRLGPEHPMTALALQSLGYTRLLQGDVVAARPPLERALAIREKVFGPTHNIVATTLTSLAWASRLEGDTAQARMHGERAVRVREQALGSDHPALAGALTAYGNSLRVAGDYAAAEPIFQRALALSRKTGDAETQWKAENGLGRVFERTGRLPEAAAMLRAATQTIERLAGQFDEGGRAQFLQGENRLSVYDSLARVLLRLHEQDRTKGHDREAFAVLEAKKGRVVAEALGAAKARMGDPAARRDADAVQARQERVQALERALREEQDKSPAEQSAEAMKDLTTRLAQTKSDYLVQVQAFLVRHPRYKTLFVDQQTVDPKVLAKFADRLPADTLVVQYFAAPDALYVFLVAAGGTFQVKSQPVKQEELYELVRRYRAYLKAAETERVPWHDDGSPVYRRHVAPLKTVTSALSGHLLGPIASELAKYPNVVFIPNDLLLYLPIHALTRQVDRRDRFLAETHVVSYLTQLELLDLLAPARAREDVPLLALADPDGSLPGASREVRALRGVRKAVTTLEGAGATKQEFLRLAGTFGQLHLATHGVLDAERPERSYLLVAGPDEASQQLSVGEIAGLSLQRGLAILSACDTAVGEQVPGAALITLAAAFSQAGAEAIVASLWKVNDAATRDLMVAFHREIVGGTAQALQKAQIAILKRPETAHPYYWAAFVLIGAR